MPGVKGRSGAPGVTRKAGPGRLPKQIVFKVGDFINLIPGIGETKEAIIQQITRDGLVCSVVDKNNVPTGEIFKIVR